MLRAYAYVGKAQFSHEITDHSFGADNTKALLNDLDKVDAPPTDHPVLLQIGASLDDLRQFMLLFLAQKTWPTCTWQIRKA